MCTFCFKNNGNPDNEYKHITEVNPCLAAKYRAQVTTISIMHKHLKVVGP